MSRLRLKIVSWTLTLTLSNYWFAQTHTRVYELYSLPAYDEGHVLAERFFGSRHNLRCWRLHGTGFTTCLYLCSRWLRTSFLAPRTQRYGPQWHACHAPFRSQDTVCALYRAKWGREHEKVWHRMRVSWQEDSGRPPQGTLRVCIRYRHKLAGRPCARRRGFIGGIWDNKRVSFPLFTVIIILRWIMHVFWRVTWLLLVYRMSDRRNW